MISEEEMRQRLRRRVRKLREGAGLTAKAASSRAKMGLRHLQSIEAGEMNVTLRTLARLGEALGVDPAQLLAAADP